MEELPVSLSTQEQNIALELIWHEYKMSEFIEFTPQEIQAFEEIEFQKQRENRLHYFMHGAHISLRHKKYCKERDLAAISAAAAPPSLVDQSMTINPGEEWDIETNSSTDVYHSSSEEETISGNSW